MNSEQMRPLLRTWLRARSVGPADVPNGVAQVVARLPQTRQRSRWWPLPVLDRPAPIPVTIGRTSARGFTMFSALKFIAAGVIVALFGSLLLMGVLTTPQGDEILPAAVTGSPTATPASDVEWHDEAGRTVAGPGPWLIWERAPEFDENVDER